MGNIMIAFFGGIILGGIFFGGLQWTVMRMNTVKHPAVLLFASLVIRMGLLLPGLFLLKDGGYWNLPFALFGIISVRLVLVAKTKQDVKRLEGEEINRRR